jgi:hypothetical protein
MDSVAIIFVIAAAVGVIMALSRSKESLRAANSFEKQIAALREELSHITKRVYELEGERAKPPEKVASREIAQPSQMPEISKNELAMAQQQSVPQRTAPAIPAEPAVPREPVVLPEKPAEPVLERLSRAPSFSSYADPRIEPAKQASRLQWSDIEERLGTNWLNKIGTAAFVIGVALLLNYSMHYLGPTGKIALGYALGAILLSAGILGERKERYRIAGRAVLGGGWALLYFTTYAMHNIAAVRIVSSPSLGFALLFLVAAAMVAHSLRYHSQVTTGFAYLLAFVSVGVAEIPMGGLVAAVLLAASLAWVLRVRQWFAIEPLAVAATYLLHWLWLNQMYLKIGGHKPFPGYFAGVGLLTACWLVYLISYFLRTAKNSAQFQLLTSAFLLNAAGYLVVLHYESFHPAWRFWFLLGAGAVYLAISAFSKKIDRRAAFILASSLGAALLLAAIPYRYSGGNLEVLWLVEAEALLVVGWRLRDSHLRLLGWAGAAVLAVYASIHEIVPRFSAWHAPNPKTGWLLAALALAFYVNARMRSRLGESATVVDRAASIASPIIATGFALAAAWIALPFFWPALAWLGLALVLMESGTRFRDRILHYCGHAAAALAALRLLTVNLFHSGEWHHVSLRLITVGASCVVFYLYARPAARMSERDTSIRDYIPDWLAGRAGIPALYTGTASLLVFILLWDEVTAAAVALSWGVFGLVLLESGAALREKSLRWQSYALLVASFARIFIADLNATSHVGTLPVAVITVSILIAIFYYASTHAESDSRIRSTFLWFGTIALAALLRFELAIEWVAVGWAVLAVLFYALGHLLNSATLRTQSYALTLATGIRCAFDNFFQLGRWHWTTVRVATVAASAILLYLLFAAESLPAWKRQPSSEAQKESTAAQGKWSRFWRAVEKYPRHLFFFVPTLLLTGLVSLEVRRGFLTAAWGVEALVIFLIVLKMRERIYRWFSLALLSLCVIRIVTVDVWNLDALGRIVSFLGLGLALLAVSFLYARYKEVLRKVL